MKFEWQDVLQQFWDRLAAKVRHYDVKFLAGDFNMALTQVVPQLQRRGLEVNCCAWYPWRHRTTQLHNQHLGFDSSGIFYIGGKVDANPTWSLRDLPTLTAVADDVPGEKSLDLYEGPNYPGQPWGCYHCISKKESESVKDLSARICDLLETTTTREELAELDRYRKTPYYCPYLRLKQKEMLKDEWLVGGRIHNGAHFPLCVFTNNSRSRSQEANDRRAKNRPAKGRGVAAVAGQKGTRAGAQEKGKGKLAGQKGKGQYEGPAPAQKGKPAVAEQEGREERWEQTPMGKGAAAAQKGIPAVADHDPESPWPNRQRHEWSDMRSDDECDHRTNWPYWDRPQIYDSWRW